MQRFVCRFQSKLRACLLFPFRTNLFFFLRVLLTTQVNIPVMLSGPAIRGWSFVWFEDTLSVFEEPSRLTRVTPS